MGKLADEVTEHLRFCHDKDEKLRRLEFEAETVLLDLENREQARARRDADRREELARRYSALRES